MCGIVGCIGRKGLPENLAATLVTIAHRGPDDAGFYTDERRVWLGNTRLAIQDLSDRGHQPMRTADGRFTLVYNGELYNHPSLRKDLSQKGAKFHSDSDTETLLQAYVHYGAACLQMLDGIFAFAIYDQVNDELFIARDSMGVKPLYYYVDDHYFAFASELKALAHWPELDYSLEPSVFYNYLLFLYNPENTTPFKRVAKLPPGHSILIKSGIAGKPQPYDRIPFNGVYETGLSDDQWIKRTDEALQKAVAEQMISDAPVGFFLSGGLDSSLIAAIARKQAPEQKITCFTIDTGDAMQQEGFQDDLYFARMAAHKLDLELVVVDGKMDLVTELDAMIWHLDEPQADPAALHVYHIAQAAQARGIKVLMSGTGADDVFSGYRRHQALRFERWTGNIPNRLFHAGAAVAQSFGRTTLSRRIAKFSFAEGTLQRKRIGTHFWMHPNAIARLFHPSLKAKIDAVNPYAIFDAHLHDIPAEHEPLNQMLYWEMRTFLPQHNLNYTDKMSMAASVETRVPFLAKDVIALSAAMPINQKMRGSETKHILRAVAQNYLPNEIIYRKKTGFGAPLRQWIRGSLKTLLQDRLLGASLAQWNIFNPAAIEQLIQDNERGQTDGAYTLSALLAIESWLRQFCNR